MKNRKAQRKVLGIPSNFGSDCMLFTAGIDRVLPSCLELPINITYVVYTWNKVTKT